MATEIHIITPAARCVCTSLRWSSPNFSMSASCVVLSATAAAPEDDVVLQWDNCKDLRIDTWKISCNMNQAYVHTCLPLMTVLVNSNFLSALFSKIFSTVLTNQLNHLYWSKHTHKEQKLNLIHGMNVQVHLGHSGNMIKMIRFYLGQPTFWGGGKVPL